MLTDTRFLKDKKPEIWGGIECTINRVQNEYRDQLEYSGHYFRESDIENFARLGITRLRYPLLWERHEPERNQVIDFTWANRQLRHLRKNNIIPIIGLVHHGSGPAFTDLLDKDFPDQLANYASRVATRFPWLKYYTPINEPLTTARFSGLYGYWYPHEKNEISFIRMLLNQVKATILSMQAIRKINPGALLVQTEDLAKTHSSDALKYQADFENERRWLSYDLLCGTVNSEHFFWNYLLSKGIRVEELNFFIENKCPPDIMGFNYYVTSERFLDEEIEKYPLHTHGGNDKHSYVDTEAVRAGKASGLSMLLREAWERYGIPLAITESHLSCSREEQMRWLLATWNSCEALCKDGIDIKAVTAWSLLGSYDWNSLLTKHTGHYETGVFDVRSNFLRTTALGKLVRSFANKEPYQHPLLDQKGWWDNPHEASAIAPATQKPLLIIGGSGTLGSALRRICQHRHIPFISLNRIELDIAISSDIRSAIERYKPWAIVNASGYVNVDHAEVDSDACYAINAAGPELLARHCQEYGIQMLTFSSDLVFNGEKNRPYHESDATMPINIYGKSKAEGERLTTAAFRDALIVRTSAFFGPWDQYNFVYNVLDSLQKEQPFYAASDVTVSPTYVPDLVNASLDLLIDEEKGIWHLTNEGSVSWFDFATMVTEFRRHKNDMIIPRLSDEMEWKARRPLYTAMKSKKGIQLPSFENALTRYFEERLF